jgi:hypothetical protein
VDLVWFVAFVAWGTNLVVTFMDGTFGFLIISAAFIPLGIINGFCIWFGNPLHI